MIIGAWITEKLDLADEVVPVRLALLSCTLKRCHPVGLYPSRALPERLPSARRLLCEENLHIRAGFQAVGLVDLAGTKITGQLDCSGDKFSAEDVALNCNAIKVGADVFLRNGFEAQGTIHLTQAEISENLDLTSANLTKGFIALGMRVGIWFI